MLRPSHPNCFVSYLPHHQTQTFPIPYHLVHRLFSILIFSIFHGFRKTQHRFEMFQIIIINLHSWSYILAKRGSPVPMFMCSGMLPRRCVWWNMCSQSVRVVVVLAQRIFIRYLDVQGLSTKWTHCIADLRVSYTTLYWSNRACSKSQFSVSVKVVGRYIKGLSRYYGVCIDLSELVQTTSFGVAVISAQMEVRTEVRYHKQLHNPPCEYRNGGNLAIVIESRRVASDMGCFAIAKWRSKPPIPSNRLRRGKREPKYRCWIENCP